MNAEIAARSHLVTARVLDAFGTVAWLSERDVFDFEYWPLELYKLQAAPPPREFSGHVAIVPDAGTAWGRAVAFRLAREGAHLVLSGGDADTLHQLSTALPAGSVHIAEGDAIGAAIAAFGGVDFIVTPDPITSAEHDRLGAALRRQGLGGAVIRLDTASDAAVGLRRTAEAYVRTHVVQAADAAEPASIAEAVAFLASSHAAAIGRATLLVGAGAGQGSAQPA